jgi:predicted esterase
LDTSAARAFLLEQKNEGPLPPDAFAVPLAQAQEAVDIHQPEIVIGSSFGGGLATHLCWEGPLILLAPALVRFGVTSLRATQKIAVIHGTMDTVIPIRESERAISTHHLFYAVEDGHSLFETVVERGICDEAVAALLSL